MEEQPINITYGYTTQEVVNSTHEGWVNSRYEFVSKGTIAKLAKDYKSKLTNRPYKKTSDIDVPMIDDEQVKMESEQ